MDANRLAEFMTSAQRRYSDEVECYQNRERSDSMRTLTSSEASQFVGAINAARQHYRDSQLEQQQLQQQLSSSAKTTEMGQIGSGVSRRSLTPVSVQIPIRPRSSGPGEELRSLVRSRCSSEPDFQLYASNYNFHDWNALHKSITDAFLGKSIL